MTLFYDQPVAREALEPIAEEASSRGYKTSFSENLSKKSKIGVYAEHTARIGSINSDISCKMLHGVDEGLENRWVSPESWGSFDIGFLPGQVFASKWKEQSWHPLARSNMGAFIVGWPKSDGIYSNEFKEKIKTIKSDIGDTSDSFVLYAPSGATSDERKIKEFLDSAEEVFDQILIKHHPDVPEQVPSSLKSRVRNDNRINIINKEKNIIDFLGVSDVVVSEESSVLLESVLTKTVPISVVDWPIGSNWKDSYNHTVPEIAVSTTGAELPKTLQRVDHSYGAYLSDIIESRSDYFEYIGSASEHTVDIIEKVNSGRFDQLNPVEPNKDLNLRKAYLISNDIMLDKLGEKTKKRLRKAGLGKMKSYVDQRVG